MTRNKFQWDLSLDENLIFFFTEITKHFRYKAEEVPTQDPS